MKKILPNIVNGYIQLYVWQRWIVWILGYLLMLSVLFNLFVVPPLKKITLLKQTILRHQAEIVNLQRNLSELQSYQWQYRLIRFNENFVTTQCQQPINDNLIFAELNQLAVENHLTVLKAEPLPMYHYHWCFTGSYSQFYHWLSRVFTLPQMMLLKSCHIMSSSHDNTVSDDLIIEVTVEALPWSSRLCEYF